MAKTNGSGRDTNLVLKLFEEVAAARSAISDMQKKTDRSLATIARVVGQLHGHNVRRFTKIERRLDSIEARIA